VPENGLWNVERFQLLLRDAGDVRVLQPAPWLNPRRLALLLGSGALVLGGALVFLWAHSRRQVAQREVARRMAEAEFAAILGERNRVARDIHDTLAQGLNAVSMQLELAKNMAAKGSSAVLPHVATAHTIVRSCLAEARESIWNMRSHALERTDLAGALGGVLRQMSEGLPIETSIEVSGQSRRLAPSWRTTSSGSDRRASRTPSSTPPRPGSRCTSTSNPEKYGCASRTTGAVSTLSPPAARRAVSGSRAFKSASGKWPRRCASKAHRARAPCCWSKLLHPTKVD
jgi:hypothetical protein